MRTALTREMWEALNDDWRRLEGVDDIRAEPRAASCRSCWTGPSASADLFRGAAETSMLRNDG